jgi:hypothetical protein
MEIDSAADQPTEVTSSRNGGRGVTLVEVVVLLFLAVMLALLGQWTFQDVALLIAVTIVFVVLFLMTVAKAGRKALVFLAVALIPLTFLLVKLPILYPLRTHLKGGAFQSVPLATVLQHISEQKPDVPIWRFEVYDKKAAESLITVTLPDSCTLQQVLDRVAECVQCDYDWCWHKCCGNEPSPGCATFRLRGRGSTLASLSEYYLFVEQDRVYRPEKPLDATRGKSNR